MLNNIFWNYGVIIKNLFYKIETSHKLIPVKKVDKDEIKDLRKDLVYVKGIQLFPEMIYKFFVIH